MEKSLGSAPELLGVLLGWKRYRVQHGVLVRLQAGTSLRDAKQGDFGEYDLALTVTQLRQLSHDLNRAADEVEGRVPDMKPRWWKRS